MLAKVIVQDLKTKISYRGVIELEDLKQGSSPILTLSDTKLPIGYQIPTIRGWMHAVSQEPKVYLFDVNGGTHLIKPDK